MNNSLHPQPTTQRSWPAAYKAFILDRHASFLLKIAPIAILIGSPEIIVSNIVPVVGEIADVGGLTLTAIVAFRTLAAVRKYR